MRKFILFIIITTSTFACRNTVKPIETEENSFSIISQMHYSKPQDSFIFIKEHLTFQVKSSGDTLIYSHQRDSMRNFARNPKQVQLNFTDTIPRKYGRLEYFVNGKLIVKNDLYREEPVYRLDKVTKTFNIPQGKENIKIFKLKSNYYKDSKGDTLLLNSTEYWTEKFGRIAKVDENFNRRSRRKIMLVEASNSFGDKLYAKDIEKLIFNDSISWKLRSEDGSPEF